MIAFSLAGADAAAHTIERGNLHTELVALVAEHFFRGKRCGFVRACRYHRGADTSVRADERALVTLDTLGCVPLGYVDRYAAFFVLGGAGGNGAVRIECGGGEFVAL